METAQDKAVRLGRLVRERRRELRLTQRDAGARGGISEQTWGVVENAKADHYADLTLSAIDAGLAWQPGTAAAILADPRHQPQAASSVTSDEDLLAEVTDVLRRVQERLETARERLRQPADTPADRRAR